MITKKEPHSVVETDTAVALRLQDDYSMNDIQTILKQELDTKFAPKHLLSLQLSESYKRLGWHTKAHRCEVCGTILEFIKGVTEGPEAFKLYKANFCKDRLCPMCAYRRSLKIYGHTSKIMDHLSENYKLRYLFLTLTIPNCEGYKLSETLDYMQSAWIKLMKHYRVKNVVEGAVKVLEVTHNSNRYSKSFDTYHPHYHVILAVKPSYFGKSYINQAEWLKLWKMAMGDPTITQVHIETIKAQDAEEAGKSLNGAVAEVAKYSVKSGDFLYQDTRFTDDVVRILGTALKGRRLLSYTGIFKKIHALLNLDDTEDGDLTNAENHELRQDIAYCIVRYNWGSGAYKLSSFLKISQDGEVLS